MATSCWNKFNSIKEVKRFYKAFAMTEGCGIRTRSSKTNSYIFVCSNEGHHKVKTSENEEGEYNKRKTKKKCSTS